MVPYLRTRHGAIALAHRGFSLDGRENSLAAFAAARALGLEHVETDAHATADGVAVALHDERLDRTTDATGLVAALPWDVVRRARIAGGEPVPRLDEVLGELPDLRVNVDVKSDDAVGPVVEAVQRTAAHDRVCLTSFSTRRRRRAVAVLGRPVATSAGQAEVVAFLAAVRAPRLPARTRAAAVRAALRHVDCIQVPERSGRLVVVDAATVAAAHAAGRQVHVWTVDDPADQGRLLDLGVDGLVTDRADVLRDVLRARGAWGGR
ncbi:glycerophosphodiester phosphodiesterase family protein [Cellulomonas marina]|uniref:Glycerophosphoryl diester phosphodiesterase n=1 Tax=Cellulomonas marina TaxID=988821 RepID=A0A1I0ZG30_9CELL|nr:glycerophosphodiester phosphodiesterase family protein [Cellulomonas marina]GIG28547.1 glycerophosphoryl diester phosphodiesterase [Cellulomonas marina]SFB24605.1 glycerophosphoryl diester phosphodiesterase [Cellulomonas marina]